MTEIETEVTETEISEAVAEVEAEEIRDARAILAKNRQLVSDMVKIRDRNAALEELARAVGLDDAALADPRGTIATRAEASKAARERAQAVKDAVLTKLISEGRTVKGTVEELVAKVLADPNVKLDGDKVTGLDTALSVAPRKAAPGPPPPWSGQSIQRPASPKTLEELQSKGPDAVKLFAQRSPEVYESLRADWQRRLANPGTRR